MTNGREADWLSIKQTLKVMTFNIHNGINRYGKFNLEEIAEFISQIKPDLAGIQEVSRFWSRKTNYQDMVIVFAEKLGMYPAFSTSLRRNDKALFGNLILSRFPIINTWTEILPGNLEPRSNIIVQVLAGRVRINFLTTHLGLSEAERQAQISQIVKSGLQIGEPLIITGDFNQNPSGPGVALLKKNWIKHAPSSPQGTLWLSDKVGPEIDMIFSSPDLKLKSIKVYQIELSDHLPVIAEFELGLTWPQVAGQPVY